MSVLGNFKFATVEPKHSFLNRLTDRLSGEDLRKYQASHSVRSSRPGISSFDYSPSYTNRLWLSWCYWCEDEVSILSDVLQKMRDEIVRYGFKWKPAFSRKCEVCGQEYQDTVKKCEVCGSERLRKPDRSQLRLARIDEYNTFLEKANINEQTMQDVTKQLLLHTLNTDNGFLLSHREYHWNDDGEVVSSFPREFLALDPRDVIKLFDFETGYPGKGLVCLDHRSTLLSEKDERCPVCGKKTYRAFYQVFTATKTSTYYIKDEIRHLMFYYPTIIYGTPKCFKIRDLLITYHMIDRRVRYYYEYCKVPGILFIPTDNPEGIQEMWKKVREETADDPHTPAILGVSESAPTNANFIKLMEDPNANLISVKDDLRDRIASSYGVTMAFTNDTSQTGGLKNDKNLISLADRTIRSLQKTLDEKVFRWITLSMGITDWLLECEPNINENKLEEEEVIAAKLANMEKFTQLGIRAKWVDGDYVLTENPDNDLVDYETPMGIPNMADADAMVQGEMPKEEPDEDVPLMPPQPKQEKEVPLDPDASNKFADAALGITTAPSKLKVTSELSRIFDDIFYPTYAYEKRKEKAEEDAEEGGESADAGLGPEGEMQ